MEGGIPTLLSSTINLNSGGTGTFDAGKLSVPFKVPMLIDEIRWSVRLKDAAADIARSNGGALIRCKLTLGELELTNGFIPIWLFGGTTQDDVEQTGTIVSATDEAFYSHFRWKLPRPLFVGAGNALRAYAMRGADARSPGKVTIAYAGRVFPEAQRPKEIDVPWVTAYLATVGAATGTSGTLDLHNPFHQPLHVQKFVGRILSTANATQAFDDVAAGYDDFEIQLRTSSGYQIIKDFVPFYSVFDWNRRAWTIGKELPPREHYLLQFQGGVANRQMMVALNGWRKERLS